MFGLSKPNLVQARPRRRIGAAHKRDAFFNKKLRAGETLFARGELKECIYRVDEGAIRIAAACSHGSDDTIEEISSGTVFGLGNLDYHIHTATAVTDCVVSFWPRSALAGMERTSAEIAERQKDAVEREFIFLRDLAATTNAARPVARVAALLSYLANTNGNEGRSPDVIDECIQCAVVADYLNIDIPTLSGALRELECLGIIAYHHPRAIKICDNAHLERLASGAD